ncbi:hypothetical protein FQN60_017592 [Etheostoma spectabile]|uniref:H15 domain-containing protein n=2 Tax=Etheostoma spectabile TaxID=54343 RepID=A0A5J5CAK5_9PERO|nr:hypothetical protein FQN60_017455 [Etheostoma spectabile]KAA8592137.1 hypothetical protein FQN60_017592 [Etheostoma spectabile]
MTYPTCASSNSVELARGSRCTSSSSAVSSRLCSVTRLSSSSSSIRKGCDEVGSSSGQEYCWKKGWDSAASAVSRSMGLKHRHCVENQLHLLQLMSSWGKGTGQSETSREETKDHRRVILTSRKACFIAKASRITSFLMATRCLLRSSTAERTRPVTPVPRGRRMLGSQHQAGVTVDGICSVCNNQRRKKERKKESNHRYSPGHYAAAARRPETKIRGNDATDTQAHTYKGKADFGFPDCGAASHQTKNEHHHADADDDSCRDQSVLVLNETVKVVIALDHVGTDVGQRCSCSLQEENTSNVTHQGEIRRYEFKISAGGEITQRLTQNIKLRKRRTVLEVNIPQSILSGGDETIEEGLWSRCGPAFSIAELVLLLFWSQVFAKRRTVVARFTLHGSHRGFITREAVKRASRDKEPSQSLDPGLIADTMSSAVSALPSAAQAKSPKKRAKSQRKKTGPTVSELILKAASASTERGAVSLAALKKALKAGGYDVVKNKARILIAIRRLVASKSLLRTKGTGASGSFKVNKKPPTPRKKRVVKKPKAKKVKKARSKKAAGGATPAAKKSPKKRKIKAKSPKKAKRPAAAKKPKKPKSPSKVKSRVAKSTRTRAAAKK